MKTNNRPLRISVYSIFFITIAYYTNTSYAANFSIAQSPLTLSQSAKPRVILNISKDHQLFSKAYDDYSDLDNDNIPDTTYKNSLDYYGYFDSYKCYTYNNSTDIFEPTASSLTKYCAGNWSGNFLNWATMSRIDVIRKILYGGMRSSDTASLTVLERAYIPNDAHSFAKFYNGDDLNKLTPFTESTGITLCNTTISNTQLSQNVTDAPKILIAKGDYSLWAASERWQCRWHDDKTADNNNSFATTGMNAANTNPSKTVQLGGKDLVARVKVCVDELLGTENCKSYTDSLKPIGLLQTYGDENKILFGLFTGSYTNNVSGGVLRKNLSPLTDEINVGTDGTFKSPPSTGNIINTLNKLRIYGYRHDDGTYFGVTNSDNCNFTAANISNGSCTNWGNPQSEIYLESLRYLAGKSVTSGFSADDSSRITGLKTASWSDPIPSTEWCSKLNIIEFNASSSSYDANELDGASDIGLSALSTQTKVVGDTEGITGNNFFIGSNGTLSDRLCTSKNLTDLSLALGTCPDAPRQEGSYQIAGLAHFAHINSIRNDRDGDQTVTTYGVALAPSIPKIVIEVPNNPSQRITLLPACQNLREGNSCSLVDYKIINLPTTSAGVTSGKVYVNWETGEQGGDYDMDVQGILRYEVSASTVKVTTDVFSGATGAAMGFGYIINGTTQDGFHAHSGHSGGTPSAGYLFTDPTGANGCASKCSSGDAATTNTYTIGTSSAKTLQLPLWYAAKWGGFNDSNGNNKPDLTSEWDKDNNGLPDRYFYATNPSELATSLGNALADVLITSSSSASVTTNSTRLDTNTVVYQAKFNSGDWTGQLLAFPINVYGNAASTPSWDAGQRVSAQGKDARNIFSYNPTNTPSKGIVFNRANLNATQQGQLSESQVEYLKGDQSQEQPSGSLRKRTGSNALLGDLINSDPWFITPNRTFGYDKLPTTEGSDYLTFRNSAAFLSRTPMIAIGGNDGMLHVFNANVSGTGNGNELFAYVPHTLISSLANYTSPSYLTSGQHKYYVDGSPIASDAYFDADSDGDKDWRTVLVGTLAAGGKGIFALDVSFLNPTRDNYDQAETSFTTDRILWEINTFSAPTASDLNDDTTSTPTRQGFSNYLGNTFGQASIVRMANGEFAAVFGNGYNSANQTAVLYIVNIKTGALIRSISTQAGNNANPNGLSPPIAADINDDRIVDVIYAGDLLGNVWKFDVSSNNPNQWDVAFKNGSTPAPLFIAKDSTGAVQKTTAKPQVGFYSPAAGTNGVLVYFGTGKYFETGDNTVSVSPAPQTQTFYGIRDTCVKRAPYDTTTYGDHCSTTSPNASRSDLKQQSILAEGSSGSYSVRVTTSNDSIPTGDPSKKGWYMDLLTPPSTAAGERVVVDALLRSGRIIFVTMTPADDKCAFGGSSWLMELDALTGNRLNSAPFDLNGNGTFNNEDMVKLIDTNNDNTVNSSDALTAASGKKSNVGIVKTPGVISAGDKEFKFTSGSSGNLESHTESSFGSTGRVAWRQLR